MRGTLGGSSGKPIRGARANWCKSKPPISRTRSTKSEFLGQVTLHVAGFSQQNERQSKAARLMCKPPHVASSTQREHPSDDGLRVGSSQYRAVWRSLRDCFLTGLRPQ